jgi:hypothetical protein
MYDAAQPDRQEGIFCYDGYVWQIFHVAKVMVFGLTAKR